MLSWRTVFFNSFAFVSYWSIRIELLGLILGIDGIVLSSKYTIHSFSFLKHEPIYPRLVTKTQTFVENPVVLKSVLWWLHSFLFCFAQTLTVLTLASMEAMQMIGVNGFKGTLQEILDIFDWNWLDFSPRITLCFIEGDITTDRFRLVIGTVRSITLLNDGHSFILKFSNCHKTVNKYYACKKVLNKK